jgi:pilus assembly protein CpaD
MTSRTPKSGAPFRFNRNGNGSSALHLLGALLGLSVALGACSQSTEIVTASVPNDYRQRHPIAITETNRSIVVFVGSGRGGLSAPQRTDVTGLAYAWVREGTGTIIADVPIDTPNARAAATSYQEIRSVLIASGVPSRAVTLRHYRPENPRELPTIRLNYPKITAVAGPCGLWPEDLGPNIDNSGYNENRPYHNFGCATQRNLAAMIDNPADLEQPRPETPAYTPRRSIAFDKYRRGTSTATTYPEADKAKLSDTGK